jgi:thiol-disulfide isomerase/thioredoxin
MICAVQGSAQSNPEDTAPYKKDHRLPAFTILQPDSTWFTKEQLPKYDYTVIVYFAPDCSHCQYEATEIVKNMDSLKNAFFVFVAYKSLEEIQAFSVKYGLNKFSNIRYGRDSKYYIPSFYQVKFTPFVAVYDRKGMFVKEYEKGVEARELIALFCKN